MQVIVIFLLLVINNGITINWLTSNNAYMYNFPIAFTSQIFGCYLTTTSTVTSGTFSVYDKTLTSIKTTCMDGQQWPEFCYALVIGI